MGGPKLKPGLPSEKLSPWIFPHSEFTDPVFKKWFEVKVYITSFNYEFDYRISIRYAYNSTWIQHQLKNKAMSIVNLSLESLSYSQYWYNRKSAKRFTKFLQDYLTPLIWLDFKLRIWNPWRSVESLLI